jgi:hypothetical protein
MVRENRQIKHEAMMKLKGKKKFETKGKGHRVGAGSASNMTADHGGMILMKGQERGCTGTSSVTIGRSRDTI